MESRASAIEVAGRVLSHLHGHLFAADVPSDLALPEHSTATRRQHSMKKLASPNGKI